jgi:HEAT repeat protein
MIDSNFVAFSVGQFAATFGNRRLVNSIRDAVVDFLTEQTKNTGKQEFANRIARLRSDAVLAQQIQKSIERTAKRWMEDYSDRELVAAIAIDTSFVDLPAVHTAIRQIIWNPFDPVPAEVLRDKVSQVLPVRFERQRVEAGITAFLEILREELVGISDLRGIFGIVAEIQTARATEKVADLATALPRIESLLARIEQGPVPTDQTLRDYLIWVMDQHRYLDPRGTMQTIRQAQVRLDEIFVSLEGSTEPVANSVDRNLLEDEIENWMKRDDLSLEEKQNLREHLLNPALYVTASHEEDSVELVDLVRQEPKLVILGDPGSGKTTLLRYLAFRHAQALSTEQSNIAGLGKARLPLFIHLASYVEKGAGRSLGEYLLHSIQVETNSDRALAIMITDHMARGECLVLLDGLDEVIEQSDRGKIAEQVDAFIRMHEKSGNHIIVTSRVAGYRMAPLAGNIPHHRIRDMNDEQIHRFLQRWCSAVERHQTPELSPEALALKTQREVDGIQQALSRNPGVHRLATNPLLLRILALIHRTGARLPQRRIELYRLAADTLIRTWELARGIPEAALVREADADQFLAELAAWMHENKPAGIATEGEVRAKLATLLGKLKGKESEDPDIQTAVTDFLSRIRQYTGLFVERAPRRYGFMHLTFEEYFAARWLVGRPREAARRIRTHLHQPRWEEPILLAIGFYGMEFPGDVTELIEEAILGKDLGGPSPYENILHRDLFFALRCLGDQDVQDSLRTRLINQTLELWLNSEAGRRFEPLARALSHILHMIQDSPVGKEFEQALVRILQNKQSSSRDVAAFALSNAVLSSTAVSVLLTAAADSDILVRNSARMALENGTLSPEAVAILLGTLRQKSYPALTLAMRSLKRATIAPEATPLLCAALRDASRTVRSSAALALGNANLTTDAIAALESTLHDDDPLVRACAAQSLGNATWSNDVPLALTEMLRDNNPKVRLSTIEALSNATLSGGTVDLLLQVLLEENKKVSAAAAETLTNASLFESAIAPLLAALSHSDPKTRAIAATALRHSVLSQEMVSALLNALCDPDKIVRERAATTLHNATLSPEAINRLITASQDSDERLRVNAIYALKNAPPLPQVFTALLDALSDEKNKVRISAADVLSNFTLSQESIDALLVVLRNSNSKIRTSAAQVLSNVELSPEVTAALLSAIHDRSSYVRSIASGALGNATSATTVVTALLEAVKDKNSRVRKSAVDALGSIAMQADITTVLSECLNDTDEEVRASAAHALRNSTYHQKALQELLNALADESEQVRINAAEALEKAVVHENSLPVLFSALQHNDERVRAGAVRMLGNANFSDTIFNALFERLQDPAENVSAIAAEMLARLARQPAARLSQDLPAFLAQKLTQPNPILTDLNSVEIWSNLFIALEALAPSPSLT